MSEFGHSLPSHPAPGPPDVRFTPKADKSLHRSEMTLRSSRPEEFHLRALPEPCVNLSIHTAPDVRPLLCQSCQ